MKRLRSVSHSIAHHGVSVLSFLHPELGEECKRCNCTAAEIDLISGLINYDNSKFSAATLTAIRSLSNTFKDLLIGEKIDIKDIKKANMVFHFNGKIWPSCCEITVGTYNFRHVHYKLDELGKIIRSKSVGK